MTNEESEYHHNVNSNVLNSKINIDNGFGNLTEIKVTTEPPGHVCPDYPLLREIGQSWDWVLIW